MLGCSNGFTAQSTAATTSVDDEFTHDNTDLSDQRLSGSGQPESWNFHLGTDLTTASQALTLNLDGTAFAFEDADSQDMPAGQELE